MGGGRSAWRRRTGEDPESSVGQALGTPKRPFKADLSALKPILAGAALEISKFGAPEPSCSESVLTSSRDSARVGRTAPFGARPEASGRRAPDGRTKKNFTFRATEAGCRPASVLAAAAARAASSRFGNSPRLLRRFDRLEKTFSARPFARLPAGEQARGRAPSAPIHARMRERVNPPPHSPRRTRALSFLPCRT